MASDQHETAAGFNVARYFVEHRHISWVLLAGVLAWGVGAYQAMPKRKDPDIPVRQVAVVTPWPGQSAERVEQLVTRKIEEKIAQNIRVSEIKSRSRPGLSVVYAEVDDRVPDTAKSSTTSRSSSIPSRTCHRAPGQCNTSKSSARPRR